jgi:hypothetical protein|tara:strand:- start:312 stop:533 length:222 start_codon:yes stop_codon:yes gene_type:complete
VGFYLDTPDGRFEELFGQFAVGHRLKHFLAKIHDFSVTLRAEPSAAVQIAAEIGWIDVNGLWSASGGNTTNRY